MARRVMATMGLLAFSITILGGVVSGSSVEFILSRALWAMLGFCLLGLAVGWAAERVVREYRAKQYVEVHGYPILDDQGSVPPTMVQVLHRCGAAPLLLLH